MRNVKRLVGMLVLLAIVVVTLLFVLENQQSVALVVFGRVGPQLPVSLLVLGALLVGLAIGPVLAALMGRRSVPRNVAK
ncbi:DUF1049 domain-containing protein [Pseudomonas sp. App30]|uniref:DUF1049 domain-containing protein n=1 Tax=Pseudomonas sp. App30 TaxID=3068990 RepID=UPI003A812B3D